MEVCEDCGDEFETKSGLSTHRTWNHKESSKVTLECQHCGDEFEEYESQIDSDSRKGERRFCSRDCYSEWQKESKTLPLDESAKQKYICDNCDSEIWDWPSQRDHLDKHFCDWECLQEWRESYASDEAYYGPEWDDIVEEIRERDEVCQICGEDGSERILDVHHLIPLREFKTHESSNRRKNLILLCRKHHKEVELGQLTSPQPMVESRLVSSAAEANW